MIQAWGLREYFLAGDEMVNDDPLSELRDIHWPKPIGIWPLAIGYYLTIIILLLVIFGLVYYFLVGRRRRRLRNGIRQELSLIEDQFLNNGDVAMVQAMISALLKRLVFFKYGDMFQKSSELSSMTGAINKILPGNKTKKLLELLSQERFQKFPAVDGKLLLNLAREQIKRCRI